MGRSPMSRVRSSRVIRKTNPRTCTPQYNICRSTDGYTGVDMYLGRCIQKRIGCHGRPLIIHNFKCDACHFAFSCARQSAYKRKHRPNHFCCLKCRSKYFVGDRVCSWKGGRSKTADGYIKIRVPNGTWGIIRKKVPYINILEHRHVMALHLNRPLRPKEEIHHRNGIKDDNRIENLELRTGPHGTGATAYTEDINRLLIENANLRSASIVGIPSFLETCCWI